MADGSTFGGDSGQPTFGSGLNFDPPQAGETPAAAGVAPSADEPPVPAQPGSGQGGSVLHQFGAGLNKLMNGPSYTPPDPQATALDQTADTLQQRIKRANDVATNPMLQFFNPEGAAKARDFIPAATEQLQKIRQQKATIQAGHQQAETLGLAPGEVPDEASQADRVEVARARALKGDLKVFKGLQAVDPKTAEAIQDQVHEVVAGHLSKAQYAYDSLAGMPNQGQYAAKVAQLRQDGTLSDLEALGMKVPNTYGEFNATKAREGQALREARIGVDTIRQKLEERNTYQPMEKKEAETYNGRMTTVYGDQVTNGTWSRNATSNSRGLVVNGASDPRQLGKSFTFATPEQRKAIKEEFDGAIPKEDVEKYRAFNRTYQMATTDAKGNPMPDGKINTNPNVQQGIAEALASTLRGGQGGANIGLLKLETNKRGAVQGILDTITGGYAGGLNAIAGKDVKPYLTQLTQGQVRDVLDYLHAYNEGNIGDRATEIAQRAGALGLDSAALGLGKGEAGGIADAIQSGTQAQIDRMLPTHQAIGGGDGVFQLGAQRPGAYAQNPPAGSNPATTQLPGAPPLQTPVQQAQNPPPLPPQNGNPSPTVAPSQQGPNGPQPGGGGPGGTPAPITVAGQTVNVALPPGASPKFLPAVQRIESGNEKEPWTSGNGLTSAKGAFQFIGSTWAANKPAGAPDDPRKATPQQQAEATANLTAHNAARLTAAKLPVNDTTLYIAHNLGDGGAKSLLTADPNADARTVVGEVAAKNNPLFFKGKPTVATVLARYTSEMNAPDDTGPKPQPGAGGATAEAPGLMTRISRLLSQGIPEDQRDKAVADVGNAAVEHAPAIGSTLGAVAGSAAGPLGTVGGGAAGGGAGQSLKDYLQGNKQNPAEIAKQTALGGVLGVAGPEGRPLVGAAMRAVGAGGVQAGAAAAGGAEAADVVDAGLKGAGEAATGEAFGRALGMVGHKVFSLFAPSAQKTVQAAAKTYADAEQVLSTEAPKLPGAGGAAGTVNPKYEAAEKAKEQAEKTLVDAGLKPEEAAYAHKVSTTEDGNIPAKKQEAEVARPGAVEKQQIGQGYQQLENEVGDRGVGAVKPAPKLPDGPLAAVQAGKVSKDHAELASEVEMAITQPAPNWQTKWTQLKDERSKLLQLERDAENSTAPGKTRIAEQMRTLADTVRVQQEKAAKYVFGEKDGAEFMGRLKVLDTRYRNLMDATNGGDLAKAATLKGDAGRDAEKKFVAFAHDDPQAIAAYRAMRGAKGDLAEATVPWTVAAEGLPVVGKVVKVVKLGGILKEWARERAAGNPVRFADLVKTNGGDAALGESLRDVAGTAVQRGSVM